MHIRLTNVVRLTIGKVRPINGGKREGSLAEFKRALELVSEALNGVINGTSMSGTRFKLAPLTVSSLSI
jgi:hypothetical protein